MQQGPRQALKRIAYFFCQGPLASGCGRPRQYIKRKWGYGYTDLNGLEKVNGEYHLILLVYNLKRSMKILGHDLLLKKMQNWQARYPARCKNGWSKLIFAQDRYDWNIEHLLAA